MLNNHLYNLLAQLNEEHKSIWRIKNDYMRDTEGCATCAAVWKRIENEKEMLIQRLLDEVKQHLKG